MAKVIDKGELVQGPGWHGGAFLYLASGRRDGQWAVASGWTASGGRSLAARDRAGQGHRPCQAADHLRATG